MSPGPSKPQVLVVQNGARHDYAVPLALAKAGMLAGFYTDVCGNQGLGRYASLLTGQPGIGTTMQRLQHRIVPEEVLPFTHTFPMASGIDHFLVETMGRSSKSRTLGWLMEATGLRGAKLIYSSMGWSPTFLAHARTQGVTVVTEFYVRPSLWRVHQQEHLKFPHWEAGLPYPYLNESNVARRGPVDVSDHLLAPTLAVKEDIIREGLFEGDKIHVVPYGIKQGAFAVENQPVPGNVLFVGSCLIVKGIHYLAMASHLVARPPGGAQPTFTAAGEVTDIVRRQPETSLINFLGRVPRREIAALYAQADVLVFPTLSDSFGMVILEAMAAGIPVICSPYCSDVVQDGISGFVVEPSDTKALAEKISLIIHDRALRSRLSQAARLRARQFSQENHGEHLIARLKRIAETTS